VVRPSLPPSLPPSHLKLFHLVPLPSPFRDEKRLFDQSEVAAKIKGTHHPFALPPSLPPPPLEFRYEKGKDGKLVPTESYLAVEQKRIEQRERRLKRGRGPPAEGKSKFLSRGGGGGGGEEEDE